ncbi:MAG: sigma-70 family RNA polymerase sigma factor [Verrucomicrobia bacterium]|nr:sigma-70 family RNA polymerase sigma factor [Verrucomicrobiota bacterium]
MTEVQDEFLPTRRTLLSRLRDWRDEESWREFFNTYWKLIYGVAIKSGLHDAEAQEVVQETVIAVAKKMPDFRYDPAIGSFKNWLLTITRRRINDQFRKRQPERQVAVTTGLASGESTDSSETSTLNRIAEPASLDLEAVWEQDWERNLIDVALEKIKRRVHPKQFQMFDLHVIKEWPGQKVAATLHTSLARVYYAKYKLTRLLRREIRNLERNIHEI